MHKLLLTMYLFDILKARTDRDHHMSQKELGKALSEEYGFSAGRKAVASHMAVLIDAGYYVFGDGKSGYWYDRKGYCLPE